MDQELKLIIVGNDHYFGTYNEDKDGVKTLNVIKKQGDYLKKWFMAANIGNVREIIVYGDTTIQVESLSEEEQLLFERYADEFMYAKSKALAMAENATFEHITKEQDKRDAFPSSTCSSGSIMPNTRLIE